MIGDKVKTTVRHKLAKGCLHWFQLKSLCWCGRADMYLRSEVFWRVLDVIEQFWKTVFCCFEGERTVLSNNGRKNLFILSWFLAEVDFWKMFIDSSAVENSSIPLHYEEEITWKVMWRKIFLWLDLFWHFLIQSFKSIAPLLHDCDPDETSLYLQLSAHISEYLLIWFSITWRNI